MPIPLYVVVKMIKSICIVIILKMENMKGVELSKKIKNK